MNHHPSPSLSLFRNLFTALHSTLSKPLPVAFELKCLVLGVLWTLLGWSEAGAQTKIYHADGNYQGSLRYVVDGDRIYYADGNYRGKLAAVVDGGGRRCTPRPPLCTLESLKPGLTGARVKPIPRLNSHPPKHGDS